MSDVTHILNAIEGGDIKATDELLPLVYEELRILAFQRLSQEKPGQTLQATALVHEAYLRLVSSEGRNWDNRGHFFKAASEAMRRILVENARRKKRLKRGGDKERAAFQAAIISAETPSVDLVALDEALAKLEAEDSIRASVVKLRYFAGLTIEQTAKLLNISTATTDRHWACARSWLFKEISKGDQDFPR